MVSRSRSSLGFTLVEVVIVVAIMGVIAAMAVPGMRRWMIDQEISGMARITANSLRLARAEALGSGHNFVVFLSAGAAGDVVGTPLLDVDGDPAAILILDDGASGTPNQNCQIDAGEPIRTVAPSPALAWGFSQSAGVRPPADSSLVGSASGSSFATPAGAPATWVLFRPDGTPVAVNAACNQGAVGSGVGGIYLTDGNRDYAVVLGPLGAARVHVWNTQAGQWTN